MAPAVAVGQHLSEYGSVLLPFSSEVSKLQPRKIDAPLNRGDPDAQPGRCCSSVVGGCPRPGLLQNLSPGNYSQLRQSVLPDGTDRGASVAAAMGMCRSLSFRVDSVSTAPAMRFGNGKLDCTSARHDHSSEPDQRDCSVVTASAAVLGRGKADGNAVGRGRTSAPACQAAAQKTAGARAPDFLEIPEPRESLPSTLPPTPDGDAAAAAACDVDGVLPRQLSRSAMDMRMASYATPSAPGRQAQSVGSNSNNSRRRSCQATLPASLLAISDYLNNSQHSSVSSGRARRCSSSGTRVYGAPNGNLGGAILSPVASTVTAAGTVAPAVVQMRCCSNGGGGALSAPRVGPSSRTSRRQSITVPADGGAAVGRSGAANSGSGFSGSGSVGTAVLGAAIARYLARSCPSSPRPVGRPAASRGGSMAEPCTPTAAAVPVPVKAMPTAPTDHPSASESGLTGSVRAGRRAGTSGGPDHGPVERRPSARGRGRTGIEAPRSSEQRPGLAGSGRSTSVANHHHHHHAPCSGGGGCSGRPDSKLATSTGKGYGKKRGGGSGVNSGNEGRNAGDGAGPDDRGGGKRGWMAAARRRAVSLIDAAISPLTRCIIVGPPAAGAQQVEVH